MTEHLFFILVWLLAGGATTCFLRFVGLPDVLHDHSTSQCYIGEYETYYDYASKTNIVNYRKLICKPRLGGKPFELALWILWTGLWPIPVIVTAMAAILTFFVVLLWQKF